MIKKQKTKTTNLQGILEKIFVENEISWSGHQNWFSFSLFLVLGVVKSTSSYWWVYHRVRAILQLRKFVFVEFVLISYIYMHMSFFLKELTPFFFSCLHVALIVWDMNSTKIINQYLNKQQNEIHISMLLPQSSDHHQNSFRILSRLLYLCNDIPYLQSNNLLLAESYIYLWSKKQSYSLV